MTYTGPWITPVDRAGVVFGTSFPGEDIVYVGQSTVVQDDAAAFHNPIGVDSITAAASYDGTTWTFRQWHGKVRLTRSLLASLTAPLPLPARAIGYEYQNTADLLAATAVLTPGNYTGGGTPQGFVCPGQQFTFNPVNAPGPALETSDPDAFVFSYGDTTPRLMVANVSLMHGLDPSGPGGADTWQWSTAVWSRHEEVGLYPLPVSAASVDMVLTMQLTIRPPIYRYIYAVAPPLRQYPRDDALGGTPRQGHSSRSVQASARQSWAGDYR